MKIVLLQVGKTSQSFIIEGVNEYEKRLKHYSNFEIITLLPPKNIYSTSSVEQIKKAESNFIFSKLYTTDFVILLCETGKEMSSVSFSEYLQQHQMKSSSRLVFVIGGAYGFSNSVYERCHFKWSLSQLTFSHQMVRLFFLEQLYRAFTIIKGEPYHHI